MGGYCKMSDNLLTCWPALFMKVRCETARKCVPREAYLDSEARDWLCCLLQCRPASRTGTGTKKKGASPQQYVEGLTARLPVAAAYPRLQQKFHE